MKQDAVATQWLPLACDPEIHAHQEVEKSVDLHVVGPIPPGTPQADLASLLEADVSGAF